MKKYLNALIFHTRFVRLVNKRENFTKSNMIFCKIDLLIRLFMSPIWKYLYVIFKSFKEWHKNNHQATKSNRISQLFFERKCTVVNNCNF